MTANTATYLIVSPITFPITSAQILEATSVSGPVHPGSHLQFKFGVSAESVEIL